MISIIDLGFYNGWPASIRCEKTALGLSQTILVLVRARLHQTATI